MAAKRASTMWASVQAGPAAQDEWPGLGLPVTVVATSDLVEHAERLTAMALNWVAWDRTPPLEPNERTAWAPLDHPARIDATGASAVRSLKLKGVGHGRPDGSVPPTDSVYVDALQHAHIGFDDDGELCLVDSARAPLGGIFLDRAAAEYRNAETLVRAGCPSIVPIALFRYEHLECGWAEGRPLGVVLCGGPTAEPLRVSGLIAADPDEESAAGRTCRRLLELYGPERSRALGAVARECGRTLRSFHGAGLFRHNGFLTNYLFDEEARRVALVDLDSSLPLDNCSPVRRPLEILRDVAGALFNLAITIMLPSTAHRMPPEDLARAEPFRRLAEGYFHDVGALGDAAIAAFEEHVMDRYAAIFARREEILASPEGDRLLHELWVDRPYAYGRAIAGLAEPYASSSLARVHPPLLTTAEVGRRVDRFLASGATTSW